jgi:hypothetical protein
VSRVEGSDAVAIDSWVEGTVRRRSTLRLGGRNCVAPLDSAPPTPNPCCAFDGVPRRRLGREEGTGEGARRISEVRRGRQWVTMEGARRISKADEGVIISFFPRGGGRGEGLRQMRCNTKG